MTDPAPDPGLDALLTPLAGLLVNLGCPPERAPTLAAMLDKRARQLAALKGRSYEEAMAHLLSLFRHAGAANPEGQP